MDRKDFNKSLFESTKKIWKWRIRTNSWMSKIHCKSNEYRKNIILNFLEVLLNFKIRIPRKSMNQKKF